LKRCDEAGDVADGKSSRKKSDMIRLAGPFCDIFDRYDDLVVGGCY